MHIQHDIPSVDVEEGTPLVIYSVPDRSQYKMTEITFTNEESSDITILIEDVSGANTVAKMLVIIPQGTTLQMTGFMRHFSHDIRVTNQTADGTVITVSASGYKC